MAITTHKETGLPFIKDIETTSELPHTISFAIMFAAKLNSFNELPKDKQPPRGIYDKPYRLEQWFDEVFDNKNPREKENTSIEFDPNEVE